MTNNEGWNRFAKSFLKRTEYIHSTFDVRCSSVSFSIELAAYQASGGAYMRLRKPDVSFSFKLGISTAACRKQPSRISKDGIAALCPLLNKNR